MKVDPSGRFLYASDFDSCAVRLYSISSSDEGLSEVTGSPFSSPLIFGNGGPLAVAPNGKFLFFSDSFGDIVTFSIASGTLTPGTVVQDGNQPLDFAVDPSNKFLYVANHSNPSGGQFSVFVIDPTSGTLTAVPGSPFTFQTNTGPYGIAVHPNGQFVYSTLSNTEDLDGLSVDLSTGVLSLLSGAPFSAGVLIPQGIAMHPSGKFLYASTAGVGSIVAFSVDQQTGALTDIGGAAGGGPVQLAIDRAGKFLYATYPGAGEHEIAEYQIDSVSGALISVSSVGAGADPGALAIVQLP